MAPGILISLWTFLQWAYALFWGDVQLMGALPFPESRKVLFNFILVRTFCLFAHGCDVISMSLVGSLMALTHSLTHSILINLLIKVKLNTFSPTSPAKYCFCPKHFLLYVWLVCQGTREG